MCNVRVTNIDGSFELPIRVLAVELEALVPGRELFVTGMELMLTVFPAEVNDDFELVIRDWCGCANDVLVVEQRTLVAV